MGCFSTCFPKSKSRKSRRSTKTTPCFDQPLQRGECVDLQPTDVKEQENTEELIDPVPDSKDGQREKLNISGRKKVNFDLNVKICEEFATGEESNGDLPVERSNEEQKREKGEKQEVKATKEKENQCHSDSSCSSSLFSVLPNSYRYQNCRDSDDELDELESDGEGDYDYMGDGDNDDNEVVEDDEDDEGENEDDEGDGDNDDNEVVEDDEDDEGENEYNNDDHLVARKESPESFFSLSIDSRKQELVRENLDKEVNSPIPSKTPQVKDAKKTGVTEDGAHRIKDFDSVLNPVENLTEWKAIKGRSKLDFQNKAKEDEISARKSDMPISEEPILKPLVKSDKAKNSHQEIAVDTSLSTWLGGPEPSTPCKSKASSVSVGNSPCSEKTSSPRDFEDRPILGALTLEEIKQFSATSTPRRSPSRSPDDMPIIGSVGSYWSPTTSHGFNAGSGSFCRGMTSTISKYREGRRVNFNSSTPFEKRLEKGL